MTSCVDASALAAWCSGRLADAQRREVEHHVDACADCRALMAAAARVCTASRGGSIDVPPDPSLAVELLAWQELLDAPIGPYAVEDLVGGGGLGLVFAARDSRLQRRVAIKAVRHPKREGRDDLIRREAKALATLSHPGVVQVFDLVERGDQRYLVMELVEGQTLRHWQRGKSPPEVIAAYAHVAAGLAAVHEAGLIHCDVKPDNVLVADDGRILLADFGLALLADSAAQGADSPGGTPRYAAPEQREGATLTPAADQYSLCVSLWEALTGALPDAHAERVPAGYHAALSRGLRPDPARRFASMTALAAALAPRRRRRGLWIAAAAAAAVAVVVAVSSGADPAARAAEASAPEPDAASPLSVHAVVQRAVAEARTARALGDLAGASEILAAVDVASMPAPLRAEAELELARMLDLRGSKAEVAELLSDLESRAASLPVDLAAAIALELAFTRPLTAQSSDARQWLRGAESRLRRAGIDPDQHLRARVVRSDHAFLAGEHAAAAAELEAADALAADATAAVRVDVLVRWAEALTFTEQLPRAHAALDRADVELRRAGLRSSDLAVEALAIRANVLAGREGKRPEGIRLLREAIGVAESLRGFRETRLTRLYSDLGAHLTVDGAYLEAIAALERAQALSPGNYTVSQNLAAAWHRRPCDEPADAPRCRDEAMAVSYAHMVHGHELARDQLPAGHPDLARLTSAVAFYRIQRGEFRRALQELEPAIADLTKAYGPEHPFVLQPLTSALQVSLRLGEKAGVARFASRAQHVVDASAKAMHPDDVRLTRYALARARIWAGESRGPDRALVRATRANDAGRLAQDVALIDAWFDPPA